MNSTEKEIIKELVEKGNLTKALESFDEFTSNNSALNNDVALLKARLSINRKHEIQATLDSNDISIENNKITKSILDLLDFENGNNTNNQKRYSYIKIGSVVIVSVGLIAFLFYFFTQNNDKIIAGKIYTIKNGIEKPIQNCLVKIVNVSKSKAVKSDKSGLFYIRAKGKNNQKLEFKLSHPEFEDLSEKVSTNFRTRKDTIFSKEFELNKRVKTLDESFIKLRNELYRETSQVLGYLTSNTNFRTKDYRSKITRFWELYNVELSAVETKEVEMQMVKIGKVISKINKDLDENQFINIKKDLFSESFTLSQIFKKELSQ